MRNVPAKDGMIICANHQSNLDPIVVGCAMPRRTNYLAKHTIFKFSAMNWLFGQIDTIAIDREGGMSGMKETMRRLKKNESILLFPEGHRTRDGELQEFRAGFVALARRANLPLLPVGVDGPFECWPPGRRFPKPGFIHVVFGSPIGPAEIEELNDEEITQLLRARVQVCLEEARYRQNESKYDRHR